MSSNAPDTAATLPELDRLERTVRALLDRHVALIARADAADNRVRELELALRNVSAGEIDPMALAERTRELEAENRDLLDRLTRARESVHRILARMRFTEEE
jgi:hypothetical protein